MPLSSATIFYATLPVFIIIALGWLLRFKGKVDAASDSAIIYLTIYVTYPAFVLHNMIGDPALRDLRNLLIPAACGAGFMLLGLGIAWVVAPWFGLRERRGRGTFAVACSMQNYGYFPFPILVGLFPDRAWAGTLFVYSLGLELMMWTVGIAVISGSARGAMRALINPGVITILIGVVINLLQWESLIPGWSMRLMEMLGNCSFPLGLLIFGTALADFLKEGSWRHGWRTSAGAVLLRLGVLPLLMVMITVWIAPGEQMNHLVGVQMAMPAAMFSLIFAKHYHGDEPTAMRVILFTTLVSFITIPFAVQAALRWLAAP